MHSLAPNLTKKNKHETTYIFNDNNNNNYICLFCYLTFVKYASFRLERHSAIQFSSPELNREIKKQV